MKISFRMDSTASQKHNTREIPSDRDKHIDRNRSKDNITIVNMDVRKAYKLIYDKPIEEYNNRQKRKDRRLDYDGAGYYDKVLNSTFNKATKQGNKTCKQHPYYEMIIQIGDADNHPSNEVCEALFREYLSDMKKRSTGHLAVIGAYIHMDEATPHMHIDYIPVATYNRGMRLQTGLNRAFEQLMGYQSQNAHDTAQMQFQAQERETFRQLCIKRGLDVDEIQHNDASHKSVNEYKVVKLKEEIDDLNEEIGSLQIDKTNLYMDCEVLSAQKEFLKTEVVSMDAMQKGLQLEQIKNDRPELFDAVGNYIPKKNLYQNRNRRFDYTADDPIL